MQTYQTNRIARVGVLFLGVLTAYLLISQACFAAPSTHASPSVNLVDHGQAKAVIVIPDDTTAQPAEKNWQLFLQEPLILSDARQSAQILSEYIQQCTGAQLSIVSESNRPANTNAIHVGRTTVAEKLLASVGTLDDDGFLIAVPDASNVILVGATEPATEFAVYDFLESELGVRWLFAGDLGEHVPSHESLSISGVQRISQPKFVSRFFRVEHEGGDTWTRRNRVHQRIAFHHNIEKVVPVRGEKSWTAKHPEYFPLIENKRYLPERTNTSDWHLCYTADGVAQAMSDLVIDSLNQYPRYKSFSLGISDGGPETYCHCEPCLAARKDAGINAFGFNDYSNQYYQWCNDVVAGITAVKPDITVGCMAYREVAEAPDFDIHDRLVPHITYELVQWADAGRREQFKKIVEAWSDRAKQLGHYEYMFGELNITIPRLYAHSLADYLRYANDQGVIGFYAETTRMRANAMAYVGPQPYLLLRLLWNPDADVDLLINDWCASAVGVDAAPYLEKYYQRWEQIWTERIPKTMWFGIGSAPRTYLKYNSDEYLQAVTTDDLDACEQLLVLAFENAPAQGPQHDRAAMFLADFRKHRAERLDYQVAVWDLQRQLATPATEQSTGQSTKQSIAPIYHQSFNHGFAGWAPASANDTVKAIADADSNTLRFTKDSSLESPMIELKPDQTYVVTFRVKANQVYKNTRLTFAMRAYPDTPAGEHGEQKEPEYAIQRNMRGEDFTGQWQDLRYVFRTQPSAGSSVRLRCTVLARVMDYGNLELDEVSVTAH